MNRKRNLSVLLTLCIILVSATAGFAADFTDISDNPYKDSITNMSELGILEGVGGNRFAPENELNRAAAAKVAAFLLGYTETEAEEAAGWVPLFGDVQGTSHQWALGWINLMAKDGILLGVGDHAYAPGAPLQMAHWLTILLRITKHETPGMAWPDDYNDKAEELELTAGLPYVAAKTMNRGEMAKMSTTAIYDVARPDGKLIIDIVDFKPADPEPPASEEPSSYNDGKLKLTADRTYVNNGGGQVIRLTATATYGTNNLPAVGAQIQFFADVEGNPRIGQLSDQEVIANAQGIASTTYATLAQDNNKQISFLANMATDGDWIEERLSVLSSDSAASISGRVVNPFTGTSPTNAEGGISAGSNYIAVNISSDGSYAAAVPQGNYHVHFNFNVAGSVPHSGDFTGSHFNLKSNGDMRLSIQKNFTAGSTYTLASEMGILTGIPGRIGANADLYPTVMGTNDTVIARTNSEGRFMTALPPGLYVLYNGTGAALKSNIIVEKGKVTELGAF
ncbi:MAG: S-layer homology domain-containing protein [Eubacteriales bacterium]|nr:S-layer homology domain-containing protein [Eubacteriales bacterium]